jgi:hypothetical protein
MSPSWPDRLHLAKTNADVTAVARNFVSQLASEDIQGLPQICRPGPLATAEDVTAYAFRIVKHHGAGDSSTSGLIFRLASFFSSASIRLSQSDLKQSQPAQTERRGPLRRRRPSFLP